MVKASSVGKTKQPKIDFEKLNRWNGIAIVVFLLEAVALVVAATGRSFPVVLDFLGLDTLATQAKGEDVFAAATHRLFDVSLVWVLVLSLLASAVAYFLVASYLRHFYEQGLAKRINSVRWVAYGVSSGLMIVALGLLLGVQSLAALLLLFTLAFGMGGLYTITEKYGEKAQSAATCTYWIATVAGIASWLALALYALGAHVYGANVPLYLSAASAVAFLLQATISVNFYLQLHAKAKWADYMYGERGFLVANFAMQSVVAWIIFAGSLRP